MKKILLPLYLLLAFSFSGLAAAEPVDINTADAGALAAAIKGVGPKRAEAIVQYREKHGPFSSVDDLARVRGIGSAVLESNRANLVAKSR